MPACHRPAAQSRKGTPSPLPCKSARAVRPFGWFLLFVVCPSRALFAPSFPGAGSADLDTACSGMSPGPSRHQRRQRALLDESPSWNKRPNAHSSMRTLPLGEGLFRTLFGGSPIRSRGKPAPRETNPGTQIDTCQEPCASHCTPWTMETCASLKSNRSFLLPTDTVAARDKLSLRRPQGVERLLHDTIVTVLILTRPTWFSRSRHPLWAGLKAQAGPSAPDVCQFSFPGARNGRDRPAMYIDMRIN